jgi:hypothetical protein
MRAVIPFSENSLTNAVTEPKDALQQANPQQSDAGAADKMACTPAPPMEKCVKSNGVATCYQSDWHCWGDSQFADRRNASSCRTSPDRRKYT